MKRLAILMVILLLLVTGCNPSPKDTFYQLALISSSYEISAPYITTNGEFKNDITVSGKVKNITDQTLSDVQVIITFYSKDGTLVKTADALLQDNPILAGQISPFKAQTSSHPTITDYKTSFKYLTGGFLALRDDREK